MDDIIPRLLDRWMKHHIIHPHIHPSICASVTVVFNGYKPRFEIWSCFFFFFFFLNNFVCVGFLHAIASCAFFLLPTKTLSSRCLSTAPCCVSTAPCCVSSSVLLCFSCQFDPISLLLCFLLHPICFASLLLLGLTPGLLLLSHFLLLLCIHSAIPRIFVCFFFHPLCGSS